MLARIQLECVPAAGFRGGDRLIYCDNCDSLSIYEQRNEHE